tara:strand:- start:10 stop:216 length:207 start_codon:yes stop_codon:yes gene_type:complete
VKGGYATIRVLCQLEVMAHSGSLRLEVFLVVRIGREANGDFLYDFKAVAFESDDFFGIVGEEADLANA